MRYLLDTNVFLWAVAAPEKLNPRARHLLTADEHDFFLSAASSWEISIKYSIGHLHLPEPPAKYVPDRLHKWGFAWLEISQPHALAVAELPPHHQDPFDRMLIAQAQLEHMTLLTADRLITKYNADILWCGK